MSWRREVPAVGEAAAGPSLRSRWSGGRGCDRRLCRPAPGVESAPCQPPQSAPMAGSGCAWGAEPPRFLEAFGRLWQVQSRLGSGSSASVYRVRCRQEPPGLPPRPPSMVSAKRGRRWSSCRVTGTSVIAAVSLLVLPRSQF